MCLFKRKEPDFRSDCFPKVIYMCSVINSCVTETQLKTAWTWAYNILRSWESRDADIASKQELAYEWLRAVHDRYGMYYSYINNTLEGAVKELNKKHAQDKEHKA
jgi:hypothetical protein